MADAPEAKNHGLRLTLGGASSEAYTVTGLTGWYWRDEPTPVGGPGEVPLERARAAAKDPGCPVELVSMTKADAERRRREIAGWRAQVRRELPSMRPATIDEAERRKTELAAAAGKEG